MLKAISHGAFWLSVALTICFVHQKEVVAQQMLRAGPKFGQELEIRLTSASVSSMNPEYVGKYSFLRLVRPSPNASPIMNGIFGFLKDLPLDVNTTFITYLKVDNKWKQSIVKGTTPFCDVLESKAQIFRTFYDCTSFPRKCPVRKGNVTIDKFSIHFENLPHFAGVSLNQEWKIRIGYVANVAPILSYSFQVRLERKKDNRHSG